MGCSCSSIESRILKRLNYIESENTKQISGSLTFIQNRYFECYPGVEEWLLCDPNTLRFLMININNIELVRFPISHSVIHDYDKLIPSYAINLQTINTIKFAKYLEPCCLQHEYDRFEFVFNKLTGSEVIKFLNGPKKLKQRVIRKILFKFKLPFVFQKEIEKWLYPDSLPPVVEFQSSRIYS